MVERVNVFYELLVRGEYEDANRLGEVRGAHISTWPMMVENGVVIMRGGDNERLPRPLHATDELPDQLSALNVSALAAVNTLQEDKRLLSLELDAAKKRIQALEAQV